MGVIDRSLNGIIRRVSGCSIGAAGAAAVACHDDDSRELSDCFSRAIAVFFVVGCFLSPLNSLLSFVGGEVGASEDKECSCENKETNGEWGKDDADAATPDNNESTH